MQMNFTVDCASDGASWNDEMGMMYVKSDTGIGRNGTDQPWSQRPLWAGLAASPCCRLELQHTHFASQQHHTRDMRMHT